MFNVAGYLMEERRRWPVITASHEDNVLNKFRIWKERHVQMRKPYQSPGRMKNSSYYMAPVGDWTHDLPHTVASNMVKVSHALNHSATTAVLGPPCTRKLLLAKCLRIYNKVTQYLIHNSCACLGALLDQQINKYSECSSSSLPFVGVRLVSCHSAVWLLLLLLLMRSITTIWLGLCVNCFILFNQ